MNKFLVFVILLVGSGFVDSFGQTCTQTLRLAQETYSAGRLHELPTILQGCLMGRPDGDRFNTQERVQAYKILTQAYLYLEEPEKADESLLKLLKTDGFFEIDPKIDPAEFLALYKKFRTRPVISIAGKFGLTETFASPSAIYYAGSASASSGGGTFSPGGIGFYAGIGVEKKLFSKGRLTLAPEVFYMSKTFTYTNPTIFVYDNPDPAAPAVSAASIKSIFTQNRIDFYPIVHYDLFNKSSINPFIGVGPGVGYLFGSQAAQNVNTTTLLDVNGKSASSVVGSTINTTSSFNKLAYSALVVVGGKLRIGPVYVTVDARFQYGFSNLTNSKRSNQESLFDYGFQFPDFKTHNIMGTIGVIYPLYVPKKIIK